MPANDHLGPGPGPIMLSPAGYVVRLPESTYVPGSGTYGIPVVTPVAPGAGLITAGTGDHSVTLAGSSGTLDCQITTGATGAARSVAYLVDNAAAPTAYLGVSLDVSNRPYVVVTDISGTVVAQSDTTGPVNPTGTPLHVTLTWDCRHAFNGSDFVLISINGVTANLWVTEAKVPWTPFVPASLLVGYGFGAAFNGTVGIIQVTNAGREVLPATASAPSIEHVSMVGSSGVAASLKAAWKVAASLAASASVSATLTKTPP